MTDEDVIERLLQMRNLYDDENGDIYIALTRAMNAVDRGKMIPVTESLPDTDGDYLVTVQNDCGTRRQQVSSFVRFNDGMCYSWGIETAPVYTVLAWAKLPQIWEG